MTFRRLLLQNLTFHWRGNLAVGLGVAVAAAVLTGALLVGDSLRGSLRERTEQQLGWVDFALLPGRFFREKLVDELRSDAGPNAQLVPLILMQGSASSGEEVERRASGVTVLGVAKPFDDGDAVPWAADRKEVILSAALAAELRVQAGATVTLQVPTASDAPRETPFGRRDVNDTRVSLPLTVVAVLPAERFGSHFSLNPRTSVPLNAFVPLGLLQTTLGQPGRINAVLARADGAALTAGLSRLLTLDDWGLVVRTPLSRTDTLFARLDRNRDGKLTRAEWRDRVGHGLAALADADGVLTRDAVHDFYRKRGYFSLESRSLLLPPGVPPLAEQVAREQGLRTGPTLVYLANSLTEGAQSVPYSVVAALDPALPPPLGPFLPPDVKTLKDDDIVLVDWPDSGLALKPPDAVQMRYFTTVHEGKLPEHTERFVLRGVVPLRGVADDPDLTPEFPGITDRLTLKEWDPPFPYDGRRIRPQDEEYWRLYRTTPKAYVSLATGQRLWGSRFGNLTSIRLAPADPKADLDALGAAFASGLRGKLTPETGGFVFDNVRQRGLDASGGGLDFGMLFLGFSFFLIAAALLLVVLLVRLNLDRRAAEIGLLLALGYATRWVRRLLLAEGVVLAVLGSVVGCLVAVGYGRGLLEFLSRHWPGQLDRSLLRLHVTPPALVIGGLAAAGASVLAIAWAVRVLGKAAPVRLLGGQTASEITTADGRSRWSRWLAGGGALGGMVLIGAGSKIQNHEAQAGAFFGGGALLLTAGLALLALFLRGQVGGRLTVLTLGMRNAARNPLRSLLTAGLLASAAFLIIAVESFRREPGRDFLKRDGGSGGFALLAESDVPIYQDLLEGKGRQEVRDALERRYRAQDNATAAARLTAAEQTLAPVKIAPFRVKAGDDASCQNLYQPGRPRLLGVPPAITARGGFQFVGVVSDATPEEHANPWKLLDRPQPDGAVPVFGEANSVMWMLKKGLGDEVILPGERDAAGQPVRLRIVGLLKDSVFQGELLMSEANFLRLYPTQEGFRLFLIETPPGQEDAVAQLLETGLADRGFDATLATQRLASFLEVENTYLSTFQALGGLGLLLGSLGLAVVLLRSVWERRGELALLRALGYRRAALGRLVFAENVFLLCAGLLIGAAAAFLSVLPHVLTGQGHIPWLRLLGTLGLVLLAGLAAGALALRSTLHAPLLPALRKE